LIPFQTLSVACFLLPDKLQLLEELSILVDSDSVKLVKNNVADVMALVI
jgi:hypothetical protein